MAAQIRKGLDKAAAVPTAKWLAHHAIVNIIRIEARDSMLIRQGVSWMGQAVIHLAHKHDTRIMATASSIDQASSLYDNLLLLEQGFSTPDGTGYNSKVFAATDGRGVDAIVGAFSGPEVELSTCLASYWRFVDLDLLLASQGRQYKSCAT